MCWLRIITLGAFGLIDFKDRVRSLSPRKRETFINSYFRIRGQQIYGIAWILFSYIIAVVTVNINFINMQMDLSKADIAITVIPLMQSYFIVLTFIMLLLLTALNVSLKIDLNELLDSL